MQILEKLASFVPSSSSSTHDPQSTQLFPAKVTSTPSKNTRTLTTITVAKTLTNSFLALFGSNFSNPPRPPKKNPNNNVRCLDVQLQLARNSTHIQREKIANWNQKHKTEQQNTTLLKAPHLSKQHVQKSKPHHTQKKKKNQLQSL